MIIKKCILCGSEKNRFILKGYDRYMEVDKKEYKIQQCLECKLTSLNPTPNEMSYWIIILLITEFLQKEKK